MIKKYLSKSFFYLAVLFAFSQATAQNSAHKMGVEVNAGLREYLGDLGSSLFFQKKPIYWGAGVNFGRSLTKYLDAYAAVSAGEVGYYSTVEYERPPYKWKGFRAQTADITLGLRFKPLALIMSEEPKFFSPFLHAAWGGYYAHSRINNLPRNITDMGANVQFGGGISINVTDEFGLRLSWTGNYTMNDRWDGANGSDLSLGLTHRLYRTNDLYGYTAIGITYAFGDGDGGSGSKFKDRDKDGVADKLDQCKNTPEKYRDAVNEFGCPNDKDKDSIYDVDDECPDVWGLAKFNGCPDKDGDGIQDKLDECPDVPGKPEFKGCPDTDGDGIRDKDDQCPNKAGTVAFNGCPDTDGDGTEDRKDKCPEKVGPIEYEGCPDSDNDTVPDHKDRCPDKPGTIASKGCPVIKQDVVQRIALAAKGINFESGKDVIKPSSFADLDKLVILLNEYPEAKVEIQGHTDNTGNRDAAKRPAENLTLSQNRANAVKAYLESHGIAGERLTAVGYGETQPIADNATAAGKAKNRRVDFKLNY